MNITRKSIGSKSFFQLLSLNYLMFIGAVLSIFLGIYVIYCAYAYYTAPFPDLDSLLTQARLLNDHQLDRLNVTHYLGMDSGIHVTDSSGNLIYSSDPNQARGYTSSELACIPLYDSDLFLAVANLPEDSENGSYLITQFSYNRQGDPVINGYLFLDQDLNVLSGTLPTGLSSFTPRQFQYLSGHDLEGRKMYRCKYTDPEGHERQLVVFFREAGLGAYQKLHRFWNRIWLLAIPCCLLAVFLCIRRMAKKTRALLQPLNQAILNVSQGKDSQLEHYQGPDEFSGIAHNFVQMELRLKESERERKLLDENRRQLLADISHDLKTPVSVISGYAAALKDGLVPVEEQQPYLDTLIRKSQQISDLLAQFHEYSKLDHPHMPVHLQKEDLCSLIQGYFADRYQELEQKGFQVEAQIPEKPLYTIADRQLITRCLDNLVQNAINYNPAGTSLFVSLESQEREIYLYLGDNGRGIPQSIRSTLFDPFVTGDKARSGSHGSGLGLSIVKKIVELHRGTICLAERPRWSTCFLISFKMLAPDANL